LGWLGLGWLRDVGPGGSEWHSRGPTDQQHRGEVLSADAGGPQRPTQRLDSLGYLRVNQHAKFSRIRLLVSKQDRGRRPGISLGMSRETARHPGILRRGE
jgi:hypothetical protein